MARVTVELENVGTHWLGEVVGPRGGRRADQRAALESVDAAFSWARAAVAEVDPAEAPLEPARRKRVAA